MTVEDICRLLMRSRLHTVEAVQRLYRHWQAVSQSPGSLDSFANWLTTKNYLTAYQVRLLKNGLADNFFLGPYKILDRVGKGRMAGVYKAVAGRAKVVALKVLPPSKGKNAELWARFQRETELAIRLNHPNVVRTFDCGKHNDLHYLVMEYLEG